MFSPSDCEMKARIQPLDLAGTDQEISAIIDQEGGAAPHDRVRFEEIGAGIGIARHAVKSAEVSWTQDVA
jgi:hypothetical protein